MAGLGHVHMKETSDEDFAMFRYLQVHNMTVDLDSTCYRLRMSMTGSNYQVCQAAGGQPPERSIRRGPAPEESSCPEPLQVSLL